MKFFNLFIFAKYFNEHFQLTSLNQSLPYQRLYSIHFIFNTFSSRKNKHGKYDSDPEYVPDEDLPTPVSKRYQKQHILKKKGNPHHVFGVIVMV